MPRGLFLAVAVFGLSIPVFAEPMTVRPTPTPLTPVVEPLSYTPAPESARVTDQYRSSGLVFAHTALGTANGVTSWMPTGDGWFRYPGGPADPSENQFNFYLGFRGVVTFDFVNPTTGDPDPVHSVRLSVAGVGPTELAAAYETANGWGGNPVAGVAIPGGSELEFSVSGNDIAWVGVYQMLKIPYPEVPNAWGVTEISYDRVGVTADTPEPTSVVMRVVGLAAVGVARIRGRKVTTVSA